MIGVVEGDEALGMLGGLEDRAGVLDADDLVARGVEDQQSLAELSQFLGAVLVGDVIEKLLPDAERPSHEQHLRLALGLDLRPLVGEEMGDMGRIGGRADGGDGNRFRHTMGGGQHGRAAEAVADQDLRRHVVIAQEVGGLHQILDIRGEVGVGEIALAGAEAGEIEAQDGDAVARQLFGNSAGRKDILRAGEAMCEQREGARLAFRQFEPPRQGRTLRAGECELLEAGRHHRAPRPCHARIAP